MKKPRYLIGIDLGTTNTVVYYLDIQGESVDPVLFRIPQVTDLGETEENDVLSSFLYLPDDKEVPKNALSLPWEKNLDFSLGQLARKKCFTYAWKSRLLCKILVVCRQCRSVGSNIAVES